MPSLTDCANMAVHRVFAFNNAKHTRALRSLKILRPNDKLGNKLFHRFVSYAQPGETRALKKRLPEFPLVCLEI